MLEPQNKINVDFQPSKKMKKRRELDALVCNGKIRRKSKSGHELLRTESESSEIDEFSIAAQKTLFRNRGRTSCINCKTVLIFILLGTSLVICAGLIWLHFNMKNNIQILKDQIHLVETKNLNSASEIISFRKEIEDLKKQVLSSGSEGTKKISDLNSTLNALSQSLQTLKSVVSVDSQKELDKKLEQLLQIPSISKTVATIGSDVENLKTKMAEYETSKQEIPKVPTDKPSIVDTQALDALNETLRNRMNTLESIYQVRIGLLENRTLQIQAQLSQGSALNPSVSGLPEIIRQQIDTKIQESVRQILQNKTDDISDSSLNSVLTNMDNITAMVRSLKDQFVQLKSDHSNMLQPDQTVKIQNNSELAEFKTVAMVRLETLNKSVDHLSHDVTTLMHKFILNQNSLTTLTRIVEGIKQYITILETKIGMAKNETMNSDDPDLAKLLQAENISIPLDVNNTDPTIRPVTTTSRPVIHMLLIKSPKDLELGLHRWDKNGNGILDPEEIESLPDYMPDPPSPNEIKKFDFDHTGSLDLEELKIALGFKPYPSEDERQRLSDLG